ncbi:hypothetical protein RclHR1_09790006 [Rhizophagus clarus]|uniref:Uncharacterized protein n=1 Tax=Rhizophagus clarus TaxID=94130 RepID=A0A2Z6S7I9_9GLOM|nr:hypothetical protein RclHR1_09790006 [Rhizophagus clarus]
MLAIIVITFIIIIIIITIIIVKLALLKRLPKLAPINTNCTSTPTPTLSCQVNQDLRRHIRKDHDYRHDNCKVTKTVTCTPTITQCAAPTPTCCQKPGGPGWQNSFHSLAVANIVRFQDINTPEDCCKSCLNSPDCLEWVFLGAPNSFCDHNLGDI